MMRELQLEKQTVRKSRVAENKDVERKKYICAR